MAQEEKKDEAEAKREARGGITRRGLSSAWDRRRRCWVWALCATRATTAEPTAGRHRRGPSGKRLHPLRALLRGVPP